MTENSQFFACIMAGGSGERFWPMSRRRQPKQLLRLFGESTLLADTVARIEGVVPRENIFVLTNEAQLDATRAALPALAPGQVVAEPAKRDTAPAAALAAALVHSRRPDGVMALLAADALIHDRQKCAAQLQAALQRAAQTSALLTIGIRPTYAATGFGYLEMGPEAGRVGADVFRTVRRFVEKPDLATAERYLSGGQHLWNAAMFVWKVAAFLEEAERNTPDLARFIREFPRDNFGAHLARTFPTLEPKTSVDYAIMEKARAVETLAAEFDWDDVGTWEALPAHLGQDGAGNTVRGPVVLADARDNLAISNGRLIALCGVHDLVVVETPDAILVCHRDRVQDIKKLHPLLPPELL